MSDSKPTSAHARDAFLSACFTLVLRAGNSDKVRIVLEDVLPSVNDLSVRLAAIKLSAERWLKAGNTSELKRIEGDLRWQLADYTLHRMADGHEQVRDRQLVVED